MRFFVRDDLVKLGLDDDGTDIYGLRYYVVAELAGGTRYAHEHSFLDHIKQFDPEDQVTFYRYDDGRAARHANQLLAQIIAATQHGAAPDWLAHWDEVDPSYGSSAYQALDNESFFRNREVMDAHDAGEISELEAMRDHISYYWVKYRTRHSSGPSNWHYQEFERDPSLTPKKQLYEIMETLNDDLSTGSEHWRGIEAEFENPPADVLRNSIRYALQEELSARDRAVRWQEQLQP